MMLDAKVAPKVRNDIDYADALDDIDDTPNNVIHILAQYEEAAVEKLTKLAKRAGKYGQTITWDIKHTSIPREITDWSGKKRSYLVDYAVFTIHGEAPRIGDYTLSACIERLETGNIVTSINGEEIGEIATKWDGHCAHCNTKRGRSKGYVVEDTHGGRLVVGKSCLADYLGSAVPTSVLNAFTRYQDAEDFAESEWSGGGSWHQQTLGLLAATRAAISIWGWAPASQRNFVTTTSEYVSLSWRPDVKSGHSLWNEKLRLMEEMKVRRDFYYEEAEKIHEWVKNMEATNDYLNNLKVAASGNSVKEKFVNLAISAVAAYDKNLGFETQRIEREAKVALAPKSEYFGELKKRTEATVTVERFIKISGYFDERVMIIMRTDEGHVFKWVTSANGNHIVNGKRISTNDKVVIRFTPVGHEEYRDVKQTKINRVEFKELL